MRYIAALTLLFLATTAKAQLTLEHTYTKNFGLSVVNIEDEGNKYMLQDTVTKYVELYNEDHSLWKTVKTTYPVGAYRGGISCVSKKLVNLDNDIELAYSYYTLSGSTVTYQAQIIKEDGSVVKVFPNGTYCTAANVNGSWKILVGYYNTYQTEVYAVPGRYLNIVKPSAGSDGSATLYPNPFETAATLKYTLPTGVRTATLSVYDMNGHAVRTYTVTDQFSDIVLSADELPAGLYTYKLYTSNDVLSVEKFIIK